MKAKGTRPRTRRRGAPRGEFVLETVFWHASTGRLLPRLIKGRTRGPVFVTSVGPAPARSSARWEAVGFLLAAPCDPGPQQPSRASAVERRAAFTTCVRRARALRGRVPFRSAVALPAQRNQCFQRGSLAPGTQQIPVQGHDVLPPESFGRIHHLPRERLAAVMDGLRERGLVDTDGRFTDAGRETKQRIEALTDELAAPPYDALSPAELDELVTELEPITATLVSAGSQ
jgi:hypothetical protein